MDAGRRGIAVAGSMLVDHYKMIDVYPAHSSLTTIREVRSAPGGLACNCAVDLARLDPELPIPVLGVVGQDEDGDGLVRAMASYPNVDVSRVRRSGRTSFTDVLEDTSNRTRTFFQFRGSNAEFSPEHVDLDDLDVDILHVGYILLLDTMDSPHPEAGTQMAELLRRCREKGIRTSVDIVSEDSGRFASIVPPALAHASFCIINELEACRTTGIVPELDANGRLRPESLVPVLEALRLLGVQEWVVIHWRDGAIGQRPDGSTEFRPALVVPDEEVISATGAGDAFLAGALYSAWRGDDLGVALEVGTATAAASLRAPNATDGVVTYSEALRQYRTGRPDTGAAASDSGLGEV